MFSISCLTSNFVGKGKENEEGMEGGGKGEGGGKSLSGIVSKTKKGKLTSGLDLVMMTLKLLFYLDSSVDCLGGWKKRSY